MLRRDADTTSSLSVGREEALAKGCILFSRSSKSSAALVVQHQLAAESGTFADVLALPLRLPLRLPPRPPCLLLRSVLQFPPRLSPQLSASCRCRRRSCSCNCDCDCSYNFTAIAAAIAAAITTVIAAAFGVVYRCGCRRDYRCGCRRDRRRLSLQLLLRFRHCRCDCCRDCRRH